MITSAGAKFDKGFAAERTGASTRSTIAWPWPVGKLGCEQFSDREFAGRGAAEERNDLGHPRAAACEISLISRSSNSCCRRVVISPRRLLPITRPSISATGITPIVVLVMNASSS